MTEIETTKNKTNDLIRRSDMLELYAKADGVNIDAYNVPVSVIRQNVLDMPAVDAVPVVRCNDCIFFHEAHVLCSDGTEKPFSAFPKEAFGVLRCGFVTSDYGINIGAQCEIEKDSGYLEDKSVFRGPDDFCSRGIRRPLPEPPKEDNHV